MINTQTSFLYGSLGDRLDFNRGSDEYRNSAKEITNAYISPLGTVRVMKDIELKKDLAKTVLNVIETSGGFQLVVFADEIRTVNNDTGNTISTKAITKAMTITTNVHISRRVGPAKDINQNEIAPFFFITITHDDGTNQFFKCNEDGNTIADYDFITNISQPLQNRKEVFMDVYRIYSYAEINFGAADTDVDPSFKDFLTMEKIGTALQNPVITVDNGKMEIDSVSGVVRRIYFEEINDFIADGKRLSAQTAKNAIRDIYIPQPKEDGSIEDGIPTSWNDLKQGDLIVNFYNNKANDTTESPMLLLFKELGFSGLTKPADATENTDKFIGLKEYYTDVSLSGATNIKARGRILQGDIIDLKDNIKAVNVFQNRLCLMTKDTLYFSRVAEFEDFTDGVENADPFYNKLSPISNIEPTIITSYSSRGLFVLTDRGIVAVNYQRSLTPATVSVDTVSDIPCSNQVEMIDYNLYYVGADKHLYCVQEDTQNISSRLYSFNVEKFQLDQRVDFLSKIKIDKNFRLIVIEENEKDSIKMYDTIDVDVFANVKYEIPHDGIVCGVKQSFFKQNGRYDLTDKNKQSFKMKIHQPETFTDYGGSLFNDENTYITKFTSRIINSNNDQVKSMIVDGEGTVQLGTNIGRSSLYRLDLNSPVLDGIEMEIQLNDNSDGIVELQGIEYFYEANSIYG